MTNQSAKLFEFVWIKFAQMNHLGWLPEFKSRVQKTNVAQFEFEFVTGWCTIDDHEKCAWTIFSECHRSVSKTGIFVHKTYGNLTIQNHLEKHKKTTIEKKQWKLLQNAFLALEIKTYYFHLNRTGQGRNSRGFWIHFKDVLLSKKMITI